MSWKFSCLTSLTWLVLVGESVLSIQSSEKVTSISLPLTPPYHTLEFKLEVLCVIPSGSDQPNNERLTNGEVRHRPRSYSHPNTPMTAIDQTVGICLIFVFKDYRHIMWHEILFKEGPKESSLCFILFVYKDSQRYTINKLNRHSVQV